MIDTDQPRLLISACLLGQAVRYDGDDNRQRITCWPELAAAIQTWQQQNRIVAICPENLGGLPTPRPAAEITTHLGDGRHVLRGTSFVMTHQGDDVTQAFISGAQQTLAIAQHHNASIALLAAKSPSCGIGHIYSGQHQRQIVSGTGVTAALLQQHGIQCFHPDDYQTLIRQMNSQ